MIIDKLKPNAKGYVIIKTWEGFGPSKVVYDDHNAIVDNSSIIIAKCIGGDVTYKIDTIEVYLLGVLVASKLVTTTFPLASKTRFFAEFLAEDFDSEIDEVRLTSSIGGSFSEITGLSIIKDATKNMSVNWTIEII